LKIARMTLGFDSDDGRKRGLTCRMVYGIANLAMVVLAVLTGSGYLANAQSSVGRPEIADTWQGTLHIPDHDLRIVLKIAKADGGALKSTFYSIDQGGQPLAATTTTFQDGVLKLSVERLDGTYEGKMSSDGKSLSGPWKQGTTILPLLLERVTQETAWAIPEPPKPVPQMPANADPTFEVATIKPSKPEEQGKLFGVRGDRFTTVNTTLMDLIKFAYDVQDKQVIGSPAWANTDKFDINAQPDIPGSPNSKQLRSMVKKLLADRFQLKFHMEKRELSAYMLTVGKAGPKLKKADGDPNGLGGLFFQGLGVLNVTNSDMPAFCSLMQAAVLDRPVVDQTALPGKFDFRLKWTPDESQFAGMGVKVPPPSDAADAPPPLFIAIQEQLGLKLEANKAQVPVMVIDNVAKVAEN
jgi:uncharacterized protein (TIGR03435 family)